MQRRICPAGSGKADSDQVGLSPHLPDFDNPALCQDESLMGFPHFDVKCKLKRRAIMEDRIRALLKAAMSLIVCIGRMSQLSKVS